jgi:hypothetical protein
MRKIGDTSMGAGIAGAMLLAIAAIEFFAATAPVGATALTALLGLAMLLAGAYGARLD